MTDAQLTAKKPRLYRKGGMWWCAGNGVEWGAQTPTMAYWRWRFGQATPPNMLQRIYMATRLAA